MESKHSDELCFLAIGTGITLERLGIDSNICLFLADMASMDCIWYETLRLCYNPGCIDALK